MKTDLDCRMKSYENVLKHFLLPKTPVIIRLDGKAFHTFTKSYNKPFDDTISSSMIWTTKRLVEEIQNCVFGYTQSDEISLLLVDFKNIKTDQWLNGNISKITSISSSFATGFFNSRLQSDKIAFFDSRVFNLPKEEVCNYFIWRQKDAQRNAVSCVAQTLYSHKQLHKKNQTDMIEMISEKGIEYDIDIPRRFKYGIVIFRDNNNKIKLDSYIPDFVDNRDYINNFINF